jgi:hypothetical protein
MVNVLTFYESARIFRVETTAMSHSDAHFAQEKKDLTSQSKRTVRLMFEFMADHYPGLEYSAGVDGPHDCVVVKAGGWDVAELGAQEFFMSDIQLRDLLRAGVMKKCGPGYPPPLKPPMEKLPDPRVKLPDPRVKLPDPRK